MVTPVRVNQAAGPWREGAVQVRATAVLAAIKMDLMAVTDEAVEAVEVVHMAVVEH